jgi:crossover junction endodeoxyribonuclease RuvC
MVDVVGIDPSTKTGLVAMNANGVVVDTKHLKFENEKGCKRLNLIAQSVGSLLKEHVPKIVVIEGLGFNNQFTKVEMAQVGSIIRMECWRLKLSWWEVPPTVLKKWTTGNGSAKKSQMAEHVKARWGFVSSSDDVIDAYALARIGLHMEEHGVGGLKGVHKLSN